MSTIKNTVISIMAPPIVGVQVLWLWSLKNSKAFPVILSSRICFQSLSLWRKAIYNGEIKNHTRNVASQNPNISTRCSFIESIEKYLAKGYKKTFKSKALLFA